MVVYHMLLHTSGTLMHASTLRMLALIISDSVACYTEKKSNVPAMVLFIKKYNKCRHCCRDTYMLSHFMPEGETKYLTKPFSL